MGVYDNFRTMSPEDAFELLIDAAEAKYEIRQRQGNTVPDDLDQLIERFAEVEYLALGVLLKDAGHPGGGGGQGGGPP